MRLIAGAEKALIFRTKQHDATQEQTAVLNFQDRCLKPLGHPSSF
jgi:hypothetical protein